MTLDAGTLKQLRTAAGLSQQALAELCGVHATQLCRAEKGLRLSDAQNAKIASALKKALAAAERRAAKAHADLTAA